MAHRNGIRETVIALCMLSIWPLMRAWHLGLKKLALVKARLAAAKGASVEATAAADAIDHESVMSVGTGGAVPRAKRQRGNSPLI
jgi:hypothetical protein